MESRSSKILKLLNCPDQPPADKEIKLAVLQNVDPMDFYNEKENIIDYSVNNNSVLANDEFSLLDEKETTSMIENACSKVDTLSKVNVTTTSSRQRTSRSSSTSSSSSSSSSSSESSSSDSSSSSATSRSSRNKGECSTKPPGDDLVSTEPEEKYDDLSENQRPQFHSPSILSQQYLDIESSKTQRGATVNYCISPINSEVSDVDLSDDDPSYNINPTERQRSRNLSLTGSDDDVNADVALEGVTPVARSRKRKAMPTTWKQNMQRIKRNRGEEYVSFFTKKVVSARKMKPPCSQKCRLKCGEVINNEKRLDIFKSYWGLGELQLQRMFILSCMVPVAPKYKYTNAEHPRQQNIAYYLKDDDRKIRVCKTFFMNTLDVTAKTIRTVREKSRNGRNSCIDQDKRGKHKNHKCVSDDLKKDIVDFINSIPRIESHYLRSSTSREYICGGKNIADLFRDFEAMQKEKGKEAGRFHTFYEVFTTSFNIGFFQPKKDQCDLCLEYHNSSPDQKNALQSKYDTHHEEKSLSREEKKKDRQKVDDYNLCVCFDLQAVMQSPNGSTSAFYYKSKLNSFNFIMTELKKPKEDNDQDDYKSYGDVHCYFWDEFQGKRGAVEIGSCIFDYLKQVCEKAGEQNVNVTFVSDNCCGQNKNKYIASLYMFAVTTIKNLKSITHKYLIKGHTQNEADNVHSLIQKQIVKDLKSGPIYSPLQYMTAIQRAKKTGKPFQIHSLKYDFFYNIKDLQENWGYNYNIDEQKQTVAWNDIKVLKFTEETPFSFYYKTSYKVDEFKEINVRPKRKKMLDLTEIKLIRAYTTPCELSSSKKKDLKELVVKKLIDPYHAAYYDTMLI